MITEFNYCFINHSPSLFLVKILGKQNDQPFSRKSDRKSWGRKAWFHLRMSRILLAAKHSWNNIAHEQTIICRQLFAGLMVGSRLMERKKHLHRMMILFDKIINNSVCHNCKRLNWVRTLSSKDNSYEIPKFKSCCQNEMLWHSLKPTIQQCIITLLITFLKSLF